MRNFHVRLWYQTYVDLNIKADTEREAKDKAEKLREDTEGIESYQVLSHLEKFGNIEFFEGEPAHKPFAEYPCGCIVLKGITPTGSTRCKRVLLVHCDKRIDACSVYKFTELPDFQSKELERGSWCTEDVLTYLAEHKERSISRQQYEDICSSVSKNIADPSTNAGWEQIEAEVNEATSKTKDEDSDEKEE